MGIPSTWHRPAAGSVMTPTAQIIGGDVLDRLKKRLASLASGPTTDDWHEIGRTLAKIVTEDNRVGVLAGMDKDDKKAPPLSYRADKSTPIKARGFAQGRGAKEKRFKGATPKGYGRLGRKETRDSKGRLIQLRNNNLSTPVYQKMIGPRLAPRFDSSRVIANFYVRYENMAGASGITGIEVIGAWKQVLTPEGRPLLPVHFEGAGGMPKYDLRGVRKWGMNECRKAAGSWLRRVIRQRVGR